MSEIIRSCVGTNTYLAPQGSLADEHTLKALEQEVKNCIAKSETQLIIDLTHVPTLASKVLEAFLDWQDLLVPKGGRITIVNANNANLDVLHITELENYIQVVTRQNESPRQAGLSNTPRNKRLGDLLIEEKLLSPEHLDKALVLQTATGKRMGAILISKGWVSEADFLKTLSKQLGIPYLHIRPGVYDPTISHIISKDAQQRLNILPLFKVHKMLVVATNDPQNLNTFDELRQVTNCTIKPVLVKNEDIIKQFNESADNDIDISEYLTDLEEDFEVVEEKTREDFSAIDEMSSGSPVVNLVNALIQRSIRERASDIHIEPFRSKCRVRFRLDGVLYEVMNPAYEMHPAIVSRLKIMANLDIAERRLPQDGRIQVNTQGRTVDLRLSTLPGIFGEKIVLRVLDKNQSILDINKLSLSDANQQAFVNLLKRRHGLILVTGPTGSGKTTTLYAALNYLNTIEKSIVTIEDPVEYQMDIINQNQVKEAIGLSFVTILKHVLRQDPDIIMVGEIRDHQTAEIAVQAALTGHLVLSTLHTNESTGAITRLVEMGIEPYLLSSSLIGVVAQRLLRTICKECETSYLASPEEIKRHHWQEQGQVRLMKGRGCPVCYDSGYKGRVATHEVLTVNSDLQRLMVSNPNQDQLLEYVRNTNMKTLSDDGIERVLQGKTTLEEVGRVIATD